MNKIPEMSRTKHNKKNSPKGGKFWSALIGALANPAVQTAASIGGAMSNAGESKRKSDESESKSRLRSMMTKK